MLGRATVIVFAFVLFAVMFLIVMFFVNPQIDGGSGMDLLRLQLAFTKSEGLRIVQSWGESGIRNIEKLIMFDYVYAFFYMLLLVNMIGYFTKTYKGTWRRLSGVFICLAIFAGFLMVSKRLWRSSFYNMERIFLPGCSSSSRSWLC